MVQKKKRKEKTSQRDKRSFEIDLKIGVVARHRHHHRLVLYIFFGVFPENEVRTIVKNANCVISKHTHTHIYESRREIAPQAMQKLKIMKIGF